MAKQQKGQDHPPTDKPLTPQMQAFVYAYLSNHFNGKAAAETAGYSKKTAESQASRLLRQPRIKAAIKTAMSEKCMSADEALFHLTGIAKGTMADFVNVETGAIDLKKADKEGKLSLLKSYSLSESGNGGETRRVELYDRHAALTEILKQHHLAKDEPTENVKVSLQTQDLLKQLKTAGIDPLLLMRKALDKLAKV